MMKKIIGIMAILSLFVLRTEKVYLETISAKNNKNIFENILFCQGISKEKYKAEYMFDDIINENIFLEFKLVINLNNGKIYSIKIITDSDIPNERKSLGYFYVTKEKIYKINLDVNIIEKAKNDEIILKNSSVVYQKQSKNDKLGKKVKGFHENIVINKNKVIYNSYNNEVETGYYESFIWDNEGKLKEYKSGYGAERDSIELKSIE